MNGTVEYHPAEWCKKGAGSSVNCLLCPRECLIPENNSGFCGIRRNINGRLYTLAYGFPVALQIDPIEKKPLAEFLPGSLTFSLGTYGCNLNCSFCQNHHLSRGSYDTAVLKTCEQYSPETIVALAGQNSCKSIAFTYNEPLIWGEYLVDIAKCAKNADIATVLVSNAYISRSAAEEILPLIDAANFDMKGFSDKFYMEMTGGSLLPVLETMEYFHSLGGHLEITNLIIPGKNDSPEMIDDYLSWVEEKLGKNIPLHFSAYHPAYRYSESPPTAPEKLYSIRTLAEQRGFKHIYLGNI